MSSDSETLLKGTPTNFGLNEPLKSFAATDFPPASSAGFRTRPTMRLRRVAMLIGLCSLPPLGTAKLRLSGSGLQLVFENRWFVNN
jgi:hypothetical protein